MVCLANQVSQVTRACLASLALLVLPVSPERWVREGSSAPEGSLVSLGPLASLEVRAPTDPRVTQDLLDSLDPLVSQVLQVL